MLSGYMYPYLDLILPPQTTTKAQESLEGSCGDINHNILRLDHISACAIMQDEDIACRILPDTPAMFFKPLLQAAIINKRYTENRKLKLVPGSLVQLILHWPHESFVLKEMLPSLPFLTSNSLGLVDLEETHFKYFYEEIIHFLPQELLKKMDDITSFKSPLKRIDITGYSSSFQASKSIPTFPAYLTELTPKNILVILKAAYNSNCRTAFGNIEVLCDMHIDISNLDNLYALDIIGEINSDHEVKLKVLFKRVSIIMSKSSLIQPKEQLVSILNALCKIGTEFLEISCNELYLDSDIAACLFYLPQMRGLYLELANIETLHFLKNMNNLEQLDITWNSILENDVSSLCSLTRGLKYLNLSDCGLNEDDIKVLEQSHHTNTLIHLDISDNRFDLPRAASGLIGLCRVLVSVQILSIRYCDLEKITPDLFIMLLESLAKLPKLSLLYLHQNMFSSRFLSTHIKLLSTCISLRCLYLTVPLDVYPSDDTNIIQNRIKDLQGKIYFEINFSRKTVLNVMWFEDEYYPKLIQEAYAAGGDYQQYL